ncbi:MAG: acetyltransferase [Chloroflexi bacterium]|nr:acetyltransferase [Chloroflexota bacterium]
MKTIIIGAGGQARILYEILSYDRNVEIVAFVHNEVPKPGANIKGIPIVGDHSVIPGLMERGVKGAIVAVSMNDIRAAHFEKLRGMGLELINAIHPTASIAPSARLGHGVTVSMGAIISTGVRIGDNVIINTGAIIEHDNQIGDHAHVGPGCSLAGAVKVGNSALVGIGSVVKELVTIGQNTVVGAGSVVLENIPDNVVVGGTPAKVVQGRRDDE